MPILLLESALKYEDIIVKTAVIQDFFGDFLLKSTNHLCLSKRFCSIPSIKNFIFILIGRLNQIGPVSCSTITETSSIEALQFSSSTH